MGMGVGENEDAGFYGAMGHGVCEAGKSWLLEVGALRWRFPLPL